MIVVVTGGASGIGEACCRTLALRQAVVVVADIDEKRCHEVAREVDGVPLPVDVGSEDSVLAAQQEVERNVGPVDGLVTAAGVIQPPLPPDQLSQQTWDDLVRIDLRGVYLCCKAFGSSMAKRGRGNIVNIASTAGMCSMPLHAYAPAKAAIIALTQGLAAEWGPRGVRVNCVSPGFTLTPALRAAFNAGTRNPDVLIQNIALGRLVEPQEVASVIAFLLSDGSSAITGANLPVDCGFLVSTSWHAFGGLRTGAYSDGESD